MFTITEQMRHKMSEHGAALQTYNQELVKCKFENY